MRSIDRLFSHSVARFLNCLVIGLFLFSCSPNEDVPSKEEGTTVLQFAMTRATRPDLEGEIETIRMMVFNGMGYCIMNTNVPKNGTTFEERVPSGILDIYFVANELPSWNLGTIAKMSDFKSKVLSFADYPVVDGTHPIPMLGCLEKLNAVPGDVKKIEGGDGKLLERLYAKVTLNLKCTFADIVGNPKIIVDSVRIKSMPSVSYLYPENYNDASFFDGSKEIPTKASHGYDAANNSGFTANFTFYVPEYRITHKKRYTYLSVYVHKDKTNALREYTLVIGDGVASRTIEEMKDVNIATQADLTISRNRHYMFDAKIGSFEYSLDVKAKVIPWEKVEVPTEYPEYNFSVSSNELQIPAGEVRYIHVSSDHPNGWTAEIGKGSAASTTLFWGGYVSGNIIKGTGSFGVQVPSAISAPDTIKVVSGNVLKKILIKN
ncbi:MAG: subtilase-type protease inhibitor [Tannerellaceae bacterium]|nr:subtilase-type protease inhibitor [Tannerellaceae bacterium]